MMVWRWWWWRWRMSLLCTHNLAIPSRTVELPVYKGIYMSFKQILYIYIYIIERETVLLNSSNLISPHLNSPLIKPKACRRLRDQGKQPNKQGIWYVPTVKVFEVPRIFSLAKIASLLPELQQRRNKSVDSRLGLAGWRATKSFGILGRSSAFLALDKKLHYSLGSRDFNESLQSAWGSGLTAIPTELMNCLCFWLSFHIFSIPPSNHQ